MHFCLVSLFLLCLITCHAERDIFSSMDSTAEDANYRRRSDGRELMLLQMIFRHGISAPVEPYPTDVNRPGAWPDGLGKLTKEGKLQSYKLGKYLKRQYEGFLTSDPREVEVLSSSEDRCINSALCLMASLYAPTREWQFLPNYNWQPIPVSYIDPVDDRYIGSNPYCPRNIKERKKIMNSEDAQEFFSTTKFLFDYWANNSGKAINDWDDVLHLYQTLEVEKYYGMYIPEWALHYWNTMKQIAGMAFRWNSKTKFAQKMIIGPLIRIIAERLRWKTLDDNPDPQIKFYAYSAHDIHIASFINTMIRYDDIPPPFGSILFIELFQRTKRYTVRVSYLNSTDMDAPRKEPIPLIIRGCQEFCPLAFFINFFRDIIPHDWLKVCKRNKKVN